MENQHRKINGYRELTQAEIDLMNEIKSKGVELEALLAKASAHIGAQSNLAITSGNSDEQTRLNAAQPQRWTNIARTHFQEGLMALTRSIAQPTFF